MSFLYFGPDKVRTLIELASGFTKRLDAMILCEGSEDSQDLYALTAKLKISFQEQVGLSSCGGVTELQQVAPCVSALARVSRSLRRIALIVDANGSTVNERVGSLVQSLNSHNVSTENLDLVSGSIYKADSGNLKLLIKIAGEMSLPFKRHERDDYAVQLLLLNGEITMNDLAGFSKSSDFLSSCNKKSDRIISGSAEAKVREAYGNIVNLLQML